MNVTSKEETLYYLINTNGTKYQDYIDMVKQIENINYIYKPYHESYLHVAIRAERNDIAYDLLERGIDVNIQDKRGNTAAGYLIGKKDWIFLKKLLSYGVNPNLQNNFKNTLLWDVLLYTKPGSAERYEVAEELLKIGSNPKNKNVKGNSPFSMVVSEKDEKMI